MEEEEPIKIEPYKVEIGKEKKNLTIAFLAVSSGFFLGPRAISRKVIKPIKL